MRPGIGRNAPCTLGDCLTCRPKGHSWPRELWFSIYSCIHVLYIYIYICTTGLTLLTGGGGGSPAEYIMERMGKRKAAVFPDPV